MSRAAPLGPDGRTRAEERKSGPRGAGSGLPRLRCHWFLEPRPRGLKIEPPLNRDEKRSLLLRLAEQDEHAQAQEWESFTWNGRRQLVGDALFSCNGLTEAQKKRHNDDPAFSVLMQIEVAQIRQQWSEQERRGQPAYRSRIQRLHAQQVAQEDKMLRGHIGSWRANAKTSAIDEPSGCGDCEHGQVNRKTCPALVAKGRSDAAREHLTSPGTDTRTRTSSNSIGKAKEQWGGREQEQEQVNRKTYFASVVTGRSNAVRTTSLSPGNFGCPRMRGWLLRVRADRKRSRAEILWAARARIEAQRTPQGPTHSTTQGTPGRAQTARQHRPGRKAKLRQRRAEFKGLWIQAQGQQRKQQHKQRARQHRKQHKQQPKQQHKQHHRQEYRQRGRQHGQHRQTRCPLWLLWLGLLTSHCSNREGAGLTGGLVTQGAATKHMKTQGNKKLIARLGKQEPGTMGKHGHISTQIMVGTSEQEPD